MTPDSPSAPPISSMTGYGSAEAETEIGRLTAEARAVNSRFLDTLLHTPREFNPIETRLRALVKDYARRGKIDLSIRWQIDPDLAPRTDVNVDLLRDYSRQIQAIQSDLGDSGPLPLAYLLDLPGVIAGAKGPSLDPDALWDAVRPVAAKALERFAEERRREAESHVADLQTHLEDLRRETAAIEAGKDEVVERYRERLAKRIEEWRSQNNATIDEGRLEAEVLFHADRGDVTEELVRLGAHLEKFASTLEANRGPVGKDLDFLAQETLREINTIGSKSRDTALARSVLAMKASLEKIREQVQNLE
jgi:uncharacterized protein (TIGR00255 family)